MLNLYNYFTLNTKKLPKKGFINILLILVILGICLIIVSSLMERMINYKKVFVNEEKTYFQEKTNLEKIDLKKLENKTEIGFLPDNAYFLCKDGLKIYKFNIQNKIYGTYGTRVTKSNHNIEQSILKQKLYYQELLFSKKQINPINLQLVDPERKNKIDQVFFLDQNNKLWCYNISTEQLFLLNVNTKNLDYLDFIVSNDLFNIENTEFNATTKFIVYVHAKFKLQEQDCIEIVYINLKTGKKQLLNRLDLIDELAKFKLYYNYIVLFYKNPKLQPNVYMLSCDHSKKITFNEKSINLIRKSLKEAELINSNNIDLSFDLSWNQDLHLHQADLIDLATNTILISYYFSLPTDEVILSFLTTDL